MNTNICTKCGATIPLRTFDGEISRPNSNQTCASCEPPEEAHGKRGFWGFLFHLVALALLGLAGFGMQKCSFNKVAEIRQLARVPQTDVQAAVPGEINLSGSAVTLSGDGPTLSSPDTNTDCLYYRYLVERRERDSDGGTKWVTEIDRKEYVPRFLLRDKTGAIEVRPNGRVDFNVPQSHHRSSGDRRYSEFRLDPGDTAFIFGFVETAFGEGASSKLVVGFDRVGDYLPIISEESELEERVGRVSSSIFLCWGGLVFIGAAAVVLFSLTGQHRLLAYFWVLSIAIGLVLVYLGIAMMRSDLSAAHEHIVRQDQTVRKVIGDTLKENGISWDGEWDTLGDLTSRLELEEGQKARLRRVRIDLVAGARRVRAQAEKFPYNMVASSLDLADLPDPPLPALDEAELTELESKFQQAKLTGWGTWVWGLLGLAGAYFATRAGFRTVKMKRIKEGLATSPTSGVAFGITELKGVVDLPEGVDPLRGPLTNSPCVSYNYRIDERRGSGKKAKWVNIHKEDKNCRFLCRDGEGVFSIDPDGAEIMSWRSKTKREGRLRYSESRLQFGDPLYAIGMADIDANTGDSLYLCKPEQKDEPFVLSSYTEKVVVAKRGVRAIAWVTAAFGCALLAGLMLFASQGAFSPADYMAAALIGPAYLLVLTVILHYNDLVFLRQRARRNWSNIEVSLRKRYDLMPKLVEIAKGFMGHEKEVQTRVAELRKSYGGGIGINPEFAGEFLREGNLLGGVFMGFVEDYPDIQASKQTALVTRQLVALEDEIAFMRVGYNDAVTQYNTRIASLPDSILAKIGKFKPMDLLEYDAEVVPMPQIAQETWRRQQVADAAEAEDQEQQDGDEPDLWSACELPVPDPDSPVLEAAGEQAFLLATLLDEEAGQRAEQLKIIAAKHGGDMAEAVSRSAEELKSADAWARLSSARTSMVNLRMMASEDYLQFRGTARLLIELDDRVNTYEFAFWKALNFLADPVFEPRELPEVRHSSAESMQDSVATLKAHLSSPDDETNLGEFDVALADVFHATAELRKQVYRECREAFVGSGGQPNSTPYVLIQAVADGLFLEIG